MSLVFLIRVLHEISQSPGDVPDFATVVEIIARLALKRCSDFDTKVVVLQELGFRVSCPACISNLSVVLVCVYMGWTKCLRRILGHRHKHSLQESVVVMPTLGVQLETVYRSKHVKRRFVPLHRILWPVINEAVTPTTCFTYLALLLRDESRLTLTFLHVRPPVAMLLPIWSALCGVVGQPPKSLLRND